MDPPAATSHMHYLVKKGGFVTLRHNKLRDIATEMLGEISNQCSLRFQKGEEMMVKKKKLD